MIANNDLLLLLAYKLSPHSSFTTPSAALTMIQDYMIDHMNSSIISTRQICIHCKTFTGKHSTYSVIGSKNSTNCRGSQVVGNNNAQFARRANIQLHGLEL